jgi:hypothetical protein
MSKRKFYIILGLVLALVINGGIFAYAWSNATATISVSIEGEIATSNASENQPDWESLMPVEGGADTVIINPNVPGDNTELPTQYPDSGEHWDKVDDPHNNPDDSATYVSTLTSNHWEKDLYNLSSPAYSGDEEITSVIVYFRFAAGGDYNVRAMAEVKTHDTDYSGDTFTHYGTGFVTESWQLLTNPYTGEVWTWEEIDNLQAGVTMRGDSKNKPALCTQVYVEVNYQVPPVTEGEVPEGYLFDIATNPAYNGDLMVTVYLTNTGNLRKAYQYLNMKVYVENSLEAGDTPDYLILSMENGVVFFSLEGSVSENYTVEVVGGSYRLISDDPDEWGTGWSITPELYCEVVQR